MPQFISLLLPPQGNHILVSNTQLGYSDANVQLDDLSLCLLLCYQLDGNGDGEPGVLMTAQTITSESLCTTTTTHITKVHTHIFFLWPDAL